MTSLIDQAADLLYNNPRRRTIHIAFTLAPGTHLTADDLAQRIIDTERQIAFGQATLVRSVD